MNRKVLHQGAGQKYLIIPNLPLEKYAGRSYIPLVSQDRKMGQTILIMIERGSR